MSRLKLVDAALPRPPFESLSALGIIRADLPSEWLVGDRVEPVAASAHSERAVEQRPKPKTPRL